MAIVIPESAAFVVLHGLFFSYSERTALRIGDQVSSKKNKRSRRTIKRTWRKNGKKAETKLEKGREQNIRKRIIFFLFHLHDASIF